jgi:hypothetical protein
MKKSHEVQNYPDFWLKTGHFLQKWPGLSEIDQARVKSISGSE